MRTTQYVTRFTFEVVPCLILGLFRRFFHRCASILAQRYKGAGGWAGGGRGGGGGGESSQVKTRGHHAVAPRWS